MKNLFIYFMFGTGNSYRAAKWTEEIAEKYKISHKTIQVNKANPVNDFVKGKETMFGLFFSTNGFTAPWPIIKFAFLMPFGKGTQVFINASCAGWMLGKWHLPWLEGTATLLIAIILLIKGYDVCGFQGLDMPSNWLAVHRGLKKENAMWSIEKAEKKTKDFVEKIISGRRIYRGFIFIIAGIVLAYISLMYLIIGRLVPAKIMYADFNCTSCGICWKNCLFKAIICGGEKNPVPFWTFKCESCERCIAYCMEKAIQTGFLYIFLINWLVYGTFGFIPVLFFKYAALNPFFSWLSSGIPYKAVYIGYTILWVYLGYLGLFFSSRVKIINKLFTYTTPTKIFRRYHEPGTDLKDLF